jgi:hypothetical protein
LWEKSTMSPVCKRSIFDFSEDGTPRGAAVLDIADSAVPEAASDCAMPPTIKLTYFGIEVTLYIQKE